MKVMAESCDTCVFGPKSPVSRARMAELRREWALRDTHQTCHHAGVAEEDENGEETGRIDGEDIVCGGFFKNVYERRGTGQVLRIMERLGAIEFVAPPTIAEVRERAK